MPRNDHLLIPSCSLVKKDGSYVCNIIYANLSEAKRALALNGTELGDRTFTVTLATDSSSFSLPKSGNEPFGLTRFAETLKSPSSSTGPMTGLLWGMSAAKSANDVVALCGGHDLVKDAWVLNGNDATMALVEFKDKDSFSLATERLKVADPSAR